MQLYIMHLHIMHWYMMHQVCWLTCCKFCRAIVQCPAANCYMLTLLIQQHHNTVQFTHASNSFVDCGCLLTLVPTLSFVPKHYCLGQASTTHTPHSFYSAFQFQMFISIQEGHPYAENLNSETSGHRKNRVSAL